MCSSPLDIDLCFRFEACYGVGVCVMYPASTGALQYACNPKKCDQKKTAMCGSMGNPALCEAYAKCRGDSKFCKSHPPGSMALNNECFPPQDRCEKERKNLCENFENWGFCMQYESCLGQLFCKYNKPGSTQLKHFCNPDACHHLKNGWCSNPSDRDACEEYAECIGIAPEWCSQSDSSIRKFCGCTPKNIETRIKHEDL